MSAAQTALIHEIRRDHAHIQSNVRAVASCEAPLQADLNDLVALIGAHHLAEEATLYSAVGRFAEESVGQAQAFHLLLDDLTQSIQCGDRSHHEPLRYQLLLLEHLLEQHFILEERQLVTLFIETSCREVQLELGKTYRRRFRRYLAELSRIEVPAREVLLVDLQR